MGHAVRPRLRVALRQRLGGPKARDILRPLAASEPTLDATVKAARRSRLFLANRIPGVLKAETGLGLSSTHSCRARWSKAPRRW